MPERINSSWHFDNLPTSSVSRSRSSVTIWEVFATESLGSPVVRAGRLTLPGASAQARLLVKGTQTTVLTRLRFSESPWTTTTGLRKPGPEPVGSGRLAQYTCPWAITIRRFQGFALPRQIWQVRAECPRPHRLDSSPQSQSQDRDARRIRSRLRHRPGYETSSAGGITAPHHDKSYPGSRSLFSYPKYNWAEYPVQTNHLCVVSSPEKMNRTAKQIGVTIPPNVLVRADWVIR
jgi:hypothetical protein